MIKRPVRLFVCSLFVLSLFWYGCKKEGNIVCDGSAPTYAIQIKTIINGNCNSAACHHAGSTVGDFTSYAGLEPFLESGEFEEHVLQVRDMPKGGSLEDADLVLIQCWVDNNYPEN